MKDIVISGKRLQFELKILLWSFIAANLLNVFAIWFYGTNWIEILTFQRLIIAIAFLMYGLTWLGRGIWVLFGLMKKIKLNP
jgi:hypothetical protein